MKDRLARDESEETFLLVDPKEVTLSAGVPRPEQRPDGVRIGISVGHRTVVALFAIAVVVYAILRP